MRSRSHSSTSRLGSPVGAYAVLDSSVDTRFIDTKNRPALAQTFDTKDNAGVSRWPSTI